MKAFGKYEDQASYITPLAIADLADALTGTYLGLNGQESALQLADIFIYADEAKTQAMVAFDYDDRGFRLSKTTYDSLHQPAWRTWYVRDGNGSVLSIYVQNLGAAGEPFQYEVAVYGSSRLGMYRPLDQANYYELKDPLGNVRVVIGGSTSVDYLATMEAYRDSLESLYFERNKVVTVADHLNHTPDSLANRAVRINTVLDQEPNAVGAGITLRVFPGDTLRAEVFAKYEDFDNGTNNVIRLRMKQYARLRSL